MHRFARQHRIPTACPYGRETTSKEKFDEWYRFTDGVNQPFLVYLSFAQASGGSIATFDSQLFFPLDDAGWGNSGRGEDGKQHNFGFTTELHTTFRYAGGERFSFIGDDDLWVFINGKLAMDLGGLHPAATGTLDVDGAAGALGLTRAMSIRSSCSTPSATPPRRTFGSIPRCRSSTADTFRPTSSRQVHCALGGALGRSTWNSTRRFFCMPSSVPLSAMGRSRP